MLKNKDKHFLTVEDNPDDAFLIRRAFSSLPFCSAFICRNANEARSYLTGAGMYSDRLNFPLPDGIITDIRLGKESGIGLIQWLASLPEFRHIPITVLTGDRPPSEVELARQLGVKEVFIKPNGLEELKGILATVAAKLCGN